MVSGVHQLLGVGGDAAALIGGGQWRHGVVADGRVLLGHHRRDGRRRRCRRHGRPVRIGVEKEEWLEVTPPALVHHVLPVGSHLTFKERSSSV